MSTLLVISIIFCMFCFSEDFAVFWGKIALFLRKPRDHTRFHNPVSRANGSKNGERRDKNTMTAAIIRMCLEFSVISFDSRFFEPYPLINAWKINKM